MNARTVRKILMKGRSLSFWGKRAYFTIRIPLSFFHEAFPKYTGSLLEEYPLPGLIRDNGDGTFTKLEITACTCEVLSEYDALDEEDNTVISPVKQIDILGEEEEEWHWYQAKTYTSELDEWGEVATIVADKVTRSERNFIPSTSELVEYANVLRASEAWSIKYFDWTGDSSWDEEFYSLFHEARRWAKTHYTRLTDKHIYVTFSVKYAYPHSRRRFSSEASKLVRYLKKAAPNTKVMRK